MRIRAHGMGWTALLLLALAAGACGKTKTPETAGEPGAPAPAGGAIAWGEDTVWAVGELPAADAAGRKITFELAPDGNARMSSEYVGRGSGIDVGWWSVRNDTLAVQLATKDGKPSGTTSTWRVAGTDLLPLVYNKDEWGANGIPLRVRPRGTP